MTLKIYKKTSYRLAASHEDFTESRRKKIQKVNTICTANVRYTSTLSRGGTTSTGSAPFKNAFIKIWGLYWWGSREHEPSGPIARIITAPWTPRVFPREEFISTHDASQFSVSRARIPDELHIVREQLGCVLFITLRASIYVAFFACSTALPGCSGH